MKAEAEADTREAGEELPERRMLTDEVVGCVEQKIEEYAVRPKSDMDAEVFDDEVKNEQEKSQRSRSCKKDT